MCISYWCIAVIKHYDPRNWQKKVFIWAYGSRETRVYLSWWGLWQQAHEMTQEANVSILTCKTRGWPWSKMKINKCQNTSALMYTAGTLHHPNFPRKMPWEHIVQIHSLWGTFLVQTTTPLQGIESGVRELRESIVKWVFIYTLVCNYPHETQHHVNKYMAIETIK